jgi:hypothetical protein
MKGSPRRGGMREKVREGLTTKTQRHKEEEKRGRKKRERRGEDWD